MNGTDYLVIGFVVAIQAAGMVVLFMMFTRRGWWKDPDIGIDWTTTDGCVLRLVHVTSALLRGDRAMSAGSMGRTRGGMPGPIIAALVAPVVRLLD